MSPCCVLCSCERVVSDDMTARRLCCNSLIPFLPSLPDSMADGALSPPPMCRFQCA